MKHFLIASMIVSASAIVVAQDPMKVSPADYKLVLENAAVRVLRVNVAPGGKGVMHSHPDHMVIGLAASKVRFGLPDGKSLDNELANEGAMYVPAGSHLPSNIGTTAVDAIVIEFKTPAPGKAALPATRAGLAMKVLADGARANAVRTTAAPNFQEAAGTKHDYDQVVIALSGGQMSLSIDGKPAKTTWTRGEAVFIPRGTGHAAQNVSGKPVDFIIVSIR